MSGLYDEHTYPTESRSWRTECVVDGTVVAEASSPPGTSRADHEELLLFVVEAVRRAWGICPDCLGSGEGHDPGGDRDIEPCHCVAEARADEAAEDRDAYADADAVEKAIAW